MEPITLCGLVIVMFGLWVEIEPAVRRFAKMIRRCTLFKEVISNSTVQRPVYVSKMPICLAKGFH
jgi:hypothetical protein